MLCPQPRWGSGRSVPHCPLSSRFFPALVQVLSTQHSSFGNSPPPLAGVGHLLHCDLPTACRGIPALPPCPTLVLKVAQFLLLFLTLSLLLSPHCWAVFPFLTHIPTIPFPHIVFECSLGKIEHRLTMGIQPNDCCSL